MRNKIAVALKVHETRARWDGPSITRPEAIMTCFVTCAGSGRVGISARRMNDKGGRSTHFLRAAKSAALSAE